MGGNMDKKPGISTLLEGERDAFRRSLKRPIQHLIGTISHVKMDNPVAALSFDDGPHKRYTRQLLEILKKHHVRATFFMVGQAASKYRDLVRIAYQSGHVIGNHTFHHAALSELNTGEKIREIRKCQRVLWPYGSRLLRAPWGKQSNASRLVALLLGYKVIAWNLNAEDWRAHSPKSMADRLATGLRPGSIVLLHDRIFRSVMEKPQYDRTAMLEAVDLFLKRMRGRFRFVTVPQLMGYGKPHYVI